ncbi:Hsp70 family protein [Haloechinothrix halophila]|uniref:Hsp70 family protein n=1 Tax=Haloechinothrix halophila TaxID=1069073 RepID=UPI0006886038|nr:Hsp70 family protein [Haloechinothrix halophila]
MYALGIDIGTTYTAAAIWRHGHAEMATLGEQAAAIPSVVLMRDDGSALTGDAALRRGLLEPGRIARQFKRRFGDEVPIMLGGTPYSAESLVAAMLDRVVEHVSEREGGPPHQLCLTHPANWGPFKRDLLRQVFRLAGLDQAHRFITEPEAAAVFYASQQRIEPGSIVAVYDFGGGTFDASVLRKRDTGFEILGTPEGIQQLGGIDIDAAVYDHVSQTVGDSIDELDEDDPAAVAAVARLKQECVDAKQALSSDTDVAIPVLLPSITTEVRLTRAELEAMVRPTVYVTIEALRRALESARVTAGDLHSVLLVGGSSRMPLVAQLVGSEFGCPVAVDAHPKHAVALGAALLAGADVASSQRKPPVAQQPPAPPPRQPAKTTAPIAQQSPAEPGTPEVTPQAASHSLSGTPPDRQSHGQPRAAPVSAPESMMASRTQQTSPFEVTTSRKAVLIAVTVMIVLAAGIGGLWWGERAGWWSDSAASTDSGSGAGAATGTGDTGTDDSGTRDTGAEEPLTAEEQLAEMVGHDRADVRSLLGNWVPQISAKWVGLEVDGTTYDPDAILSDHQRLRQRYDAARILWSGDYPVFRRDNAYVTIVAVTFDTGDEANGWCEAEGIPADDCFAKFIDDEGDWRGATQFR